MINRKPFRALTLISCLLMSGYANARTEFAAYSDAGDKLVSLVKKAEQEHNGKSLQTQEVDQLVVVLSDEKRFLQSTAYSKDQLQTITQLCAVSSKVVMSFMLFDLKSHIDPKADSKTVAIKAAAVMEENMRAFQGLLMHLQPFTIRCLGKQVDPINEFMAALPPEQMTAVRRNGVSQMKNGTAQMFAGALKNASDTSFDEAYRLALLKALAEAAPKLASTLGVTTRAQIKAASLPADEAVPAEFKPYLDEISKVLDGKACEGLCAI